MGVEPTKSLSGMKEIIKYDISRPLIDRALSWATQIIDQIIIGEWQSLFDRLTNKSPFPLPFAPQLVRLVEA